MTIIGGITDASPQQLTVQLPDGSNVTLTMRFVPQQLGWFYDISWDGPTPAFTVNGNRLVTYPNIMRQFRNVIPFGITCSTIDGLEPLEQSTFVDGTTTLILLNAAEVASIEATYFPGL